MKKIIKIYSRFLSLENQGAGRVTLDLHKELSKDYKVLFNGTKKKSPLGYLFHLIFFKIFDRRKADYNIATTSMDTFWLNPKKSIVIVHDLIPLISQWEIKTHYNNGWYNQFGSLIMFYFTLKRGLKFKKIVCISSKTKQELITAFPEVDRNKIIVINNGVQDKYVEQPINKRDTFKIYTVSAIDNRKRSLELVEWFNTTNFKNVELVIGGKGAEFENLKELAKGNKNIKVLGFVPEEDMVMRYRDCDVFIFPTLEEGFGMPIIEAGCCNRPVITLEDGKIPKEVKDGTIVCNWNNLEREIKILQNYRGIYLSGVHKSRNNAQKFKYNYVKVIKELLK